MFEMRPEEKVRARVLVNVFFCCYSMLTKKKSNNHRCEISTFFVSLGIKKKKHTHCFKTNGFLILLRI